LSRDLERYLRTDVGVPAARVEQIYNGVDAVKFRPADDGRAAIEGCPFRDPRYWLVGTVGRMDPVKDPLNLVRAFIQALQLAPAKRERMRLLLIGDGALYSEARAMLGAAGIADLAWLPGERNDVPDILRGLDCFALPSLGEGISNTILEAMATGLPVIATDVGGNSELVHHRITGELVPAADAAALARSIARLADEPVTAIAYGRAGRQRAVASFGLAGMVRRYQSLYDQALERCDPASREPTGDGPMHTESPAGPIKDRAAS